MNVRISVVATYFNRKKVFYQTLKSVAKSKFKDFEFIVVDDGSSADQRVEDMVNEFPFLKVVRIEPENKWYSPNSCVPYNEGIRVTKGEIIILQNAECLHVHDILSYMAENVNETNYISISAYAAYQDSTLQIPSLVDSPNFPNLFHTLHGTWYNHSKYRRTWFHFCSGISRENMRKMNGFDERYATGLAYEDNDFLHRVKVLGLKISLVDHLSVIHQYHTPTNYEGNIAAYEKNRLLYVNVTEKLTDCKVNPNKNIFNEN